MAKKMYKCPNVYCNWEGPATPKGVDNGKGAARGIAWGLDGEIKYVRRCPLCDEVVRPKKD